MGRRYAQLTSEMRIKLYEKLFSGMAISQIASELGYHRATIYRELARNTSQYGYRPDWAAQQTLQRRLKRTLKLDKQPTVRHYVYEKLQQG